MNSHTIQQFSAVGFSTRQLAFLLIRWAKQSINLLFKVHSHHGNGLRTLLDNNINTSIKQSYTDITEWTELVRGKQHVTARIDFNSEGGQQVTFQSALRIKNDFNTDLKASTHPASTLLSCWFTVPHSHVEKWNNSSIWIKKDHVHTSFGIQFSDRNRIPCGIEEVV